MAALEVSFPTESGVIYQAQTNAGGAEWVDYGPPFVGTGSEVGIFVSASILELDMLQFRLSKEGMADFTDVDNDSEFISLGRDAKAFHTDSIAIGADAWAGPHDEVVPDNGSETVALGSDSLARGWRTTALGHGARAEGVSSTAVGRKSIAIGSHAIAIGRGAFVDTDLVGTNAAAIAADHLYLGGPAGTHKYIDPSGDMHAAPNGLQWNVREAENQPVAIHGRDAYDARNVQDPFRFPLSSLDTDVDGGDLRMIGGASTGEGSGGAITLEVTPPGEPGHRKNAPIPVAKFDTETDTPDATPFLLYDNRSGELKRVYVGPPDSGGNGYRALIIEN